VSREGKPEPPTPAAAPASRRLVGLLGPLLGLVVVIVAGGMAEYLKPPLGGLFSDLIHGRELHGLSEYFRGATINYWSPQNQCMILTQTIMVAIGAIGMTMIIISGGIDLSVGSAVALSAVASAWVVRRFSPADAAAAGLSGDIAVWLPLLALGVGIAVGTAVGATNGVLITRLKLAPFIITLGMMSFARGTAKWVANLERIATPSNWIMTFTEPRITFVDIMLRQNAAGGASPVFVFPFFSLPVPWWPERWTGPVQTSWAVLLTIGLAIGAAVLLARVRFGRHVFAIGSNEATARLCGVRVERTKVWIYGLAGTLFGLAGVTDYGRLTVGDPTTAIGKELDIIAAVVIGGGSLSGGSGSIFGALIGALLMAHLRNLCSHLDLPNFVQEMVVGAVIVVAVWLDSLRQKKRE
jgi:ribose transport system permease protein